MRGSIPAFRPHLGCSTYNMESASVSSFPLPLSDTDDTTAVFPHRPASCDVPRPLRAQSARPAHRLLLRFFHHSHRVLSNADSFRCLLLPYSKQPVLVLRQHGRRPRVQADWMPKTGFPSGSSGGSSHPSPILLSHTDTRLFLPLLRLLESLFHKKHTIPGCGMQRCTALWYRSRRSRKHGRPTGIRK